MNKLSVALLIYVIVMLISPVGVMAQTASPSGIFISQQAASATVRDAQGDVLGLADLITSIFNTIFSWFFGSATTGQLERYCVDAETGLSHVRRDFAQNLKRPLGAVDCEQQLPYFVKFNGIFKKELSAIFLPPPLDTLFKIVDGFADLGLHATALILNQSAEVLSTIPDEAERIKNTAQTALGNYARPVFSCQTQNHIKGTVDKRAIISETGAIAKLRPSKLKSPLNGEWVSGGLAEAEEAIKQVMISYGCKFLSGREDLCGDELRIDQAVAYITDSGGINCDESGGGRPLMISDFACGNPNFKINGVMSKSESTQLCRILYGEDYKSGVTSADSVLGKFFKSDRSVRRPSFSVLYPPGTAWRYIPLVDESDALYKFEEEVNCEPFDPDCNNNVYTFEGTLPIKVYRDIGSKLGKYFLPLKNLPDEPIPPPNCGESCIESTREVSAGAGDPTIFSYHFAERIENPFRGGTLGVTSDTQLAKAQLPPEDLWQPTPTPSPKSVTVEAVRTTNITMQLSKPFFEAYNHTLGKGDGAINPFLPMSVVKALNTQIEGTPLKALPGPLAMINLKDRTIERTIQFPYIGGLTDAFHRCGYVNSLLVFPVGYREKWCKGQGTSEVFDQLFAKKIVEINMALKIKQMLWEELASFQSPSEVFFDLSSK